jgi:chromosome partitioning protein
MQKCRKPYFCITIISKKGGKRMKAVAVVNQKGGVGKTTTSYHIGKALSKRGYKVLLIDMDPQGGLTYTATGDDPDSFEDTVTDVLLGKKRSNEVIYEIEENLDIVPANIGLSVAEVQLINAIQRELKLSKALKPLRDYYDVVVIDTPPSLGLLTINSLFASDGLIIPVEAKLLGLRGLAILKDLLNDLKKNAHGFNVEVLGILPTMYRNTNLGKEVLEELKKYFESINIFPPVKHSVRFAEVPAMQKAVFERPDIRDREIKEAYLKIAEEVEKWLKRRS